MTTELAETHTFTLPDHRTIAWCEYGSPSSPYPPVFYFHSFPSSRYEGTMFHSLATTHNLRIISPDRPGNGRSSSHPSRTLLSYTSDILALADHLNTSQFQLLSVSGGGPYLLACMSAIPRTRCIRGQLVSSVYPMKLGTQGMAFLQRSVMFVAYYTPSFVGSLMDFQMGAAARDPDPKKFEDMVGKLMKDLPKPDRAAWESGMLGKEAIVAGREAFKNGGEGAGSDAGLYARDWGFELGDVDVEGLTVWHGRLDVNCPFAMAEKAVVQLKGVKVRFFDDMGHSVNAYHKDEIIRGFVAKLRS